MFGNQVAALKPKVLSLGNLLTDTPLLAKGYGTWRVRCQRASTPLITYVGIPAKRSKSVPAGISAGTKACVCGGTLTVLWVSPLCLGCFRSGSSYSQRLSFTHM